MPAASRAAHENALLLVALDWCESRIYASPQGFRWKQDSETERRGRIVPYNRLVKDAAAAFGLDRDALLGWMTARCTWRDSQFGMKSKAPTPGALRRAVQRLGRP